MAVISLRPDLDQNVDALPLYISGALPNGKPGLAYEGRLQIHNAVGACTVEQIGGDPLPPGGALSVDHGTMEVVVAWPEYSEYITPLQNPSFEAGDLSGWTLTPKGGTATATADTSQKFDGAYSLRWPGGKGLGSEGGIEVEAWNNTIGPCLPGQRVTSHARCMYNPGGHNFGSRYQGLLRFVDGAGMPIGPAVRGRQFKGRGENGRWNDASATGIGPVGTKGVQMGVWLTGSNAPVWLDAASWDVPSSVGINIETTLNLTLRVRDSAGRTALWSGAIHVKTGSLYIFYSFATSVVMRVVGDSLDNWSPEKIAGNAFESKCSQPVKIGASIISASANSGDLLASYDDGESFSRVASGGPENPNGIYVTAAGGEFLMANTGVYTSDDGSPGSFVAIPGAPNANCIAASPSGRVCVTGPFIPIPRYTDDVNSAWTNSANSPSVSGNMMANSVRLINDGSRFICFCKSSFGDNLRFYIASSVDAASWVQSGYSGFPQNSSDAVSDIGCIPGRLYVAVTKGGLIAVSEDGLSWVTSEAPPFPSLVSTNTHYSVAQAGDRIVIAGPGGFLKATTDGHTFADVASNPYAGDVRYNTIGIGWVEGG